MADFWTEPMFRAWREAERQRIIDDLNKPSVIWQTLSQDPQGLQNLLNYHKKDAVVKVDEGL